MENKRSAAKRKGPLIRDLKKVTLEDLSPDQMHVITGGKVYSCGKDQECQQLTVIVEATKQKVVITKQVRGGMFR